MQTYDEYEIDELKSLLRIAKGYVVDSCSKCDTFREFKIELEFLNQIEEALGEPLTKKEAFY